MDGNQISETAETPGQRLARRVKKLRRERHWSLDKLSLACGVSRSMLSQIERGEANPTLAVTFAIAQAFGLSLGELVDQPGAMPSMHVVRASDKESVLRADSCRIRALTPLRFEGDLELYEVSIDGGQSLRSDPHVPGTREMVTVQKGRVIVEAGGESVTLGPGDTVSYRADIAHAIVNPGANTSIVLLVDAYD
ncbi:MAG TPA: XRE family transcriptional regulator [Gaiellaceae bacterium]